MTMERPADAVVVNRTISRLREDAMAICMQAIRASLPDEAVRAALRKMPSVSGKTVVIAVGKAAWQMAKSFHESSGGRRPETGVVITKYGHLGGPIDGYSLFEAGHPVPDENAVAATKVAMTAVAGLAENDRVILLISGGGSALFEMPLVPLAELQDLTRQLLAAGADITQINTIRKRLSAVKAGRFGALCCPAKVYAVLLSDVIGDHPDAIASGPAYPDSTTSAEAVAIADRYHIRLSENARRLLYVETPKELPHVSTIVSGGVKRLCAEALLAAEALGYKSELLSDCVQCEAKDAGKMLADIASAQKCAREKRAYVLGGETVVHVTGKGKGGRNQELALSAAAGLRGICNAVVISVGSDGTDGPTDAAGGIVNGETAESLERQGLSIRKILDENDSYTALKKCGGLVFTGPTGTNVNDISVLLLDGESE